MSKSLAPQSISDYLAKIALPAIPEVAMKLVKSLEDDVFSLAGVAALVERDPGITATVLRHANSARYGMPMRIENITDALRVLGLQNVRNVALAASVSQAFTFPADLSRDLFWKSCEMTAIFSQRICAASSGDKYVAWLVGFILRVGEIMIAQIEPSAIRMIEEQPVQPGARWKRESTIFGYTEGAFVAALADSWHFPTRVVNSLMNVANPVADDIAFFDEAGAAHIGALLSDMKLAGISDPVVVSSTLPVNVIKALGIDTSAVLTIYESIE